MVACRAIDTFCYHTGQLPFRWVLLMIEFLVLFSASALLFGSGLIAAVIAWKKEYRPWFWVLSCGPLGLLLILLKPNLREATTPEAREAWEERADWTGGVLSGFTFFFLVLVPALGFLTYFAAFSAPVAMAPPILVPYSESADTLELVERVAIEGAFIKVRAHNAGMQEESIEQIDGDKKGTRYTTSWSDSAGVKQGECVVEIVDSQLRVNGKSYGSVAQGDVVDIDGETVQVNGAIRSSTGDIPDSR